MKHELPRKLSDGVFATKDGLQVDVDIMVGIAWFLSLGDEENPSIDGGLTALWPWPQVAERLRYREGEPWCYPSDATNGIHCAPAGEYRNVPLQKLHRLAAILCDDADAYRMLYDCIQEYAND